MSIGLLIKVIDIAIFFVAGYRYIKTKDIFLKWVSLAYLIIVFRPQLTNFFLHVDFVVTSNKPSGLQIAFTSIYQSLPAVLIFYGIMKRNFINIKEIDKIV